MKLRGGEAKLRGGFPGTPELAGRVRVMGLNKPTHSFHGFEKTALTEIKSRRIER